MAPGSGDGRPKRRDDLLVVELDDEMVVYDEETAAVHHLNRSASLLWSLLDGSATTREIAVDVASVYAVPIDDVEVQLNELVDRFDAAGLLEARLVPRGESQPR